MQKRRSEHASAEALDVSGFQLSDGRKSLFCAAGASGDGAPLRAMLNASCYYYGNGPRPDYNALRMLTIFILECGLRRVSLKHKRLPCAAI